MIQVFNQERKFVPKFVCDVCGELIVNVNHGGALFFPVKEGGAPKDVVYAHKGECRQKAEKKMKADQPVPWQELKMHLLQLVYSGGINLNELHKLEEQSKAVKSAA